MGAQLLVRRLGVEHAGQRVVDGEARGTDSVLRARVVHRAVVAKLVVEAAERVVAHNRIVEAQQRSDLRVKELRPVLAAVLARRRRHGSGARPSGKQLPSHHSARRGRRVRPVPPGGLAAVGGTSESHFKKRSDNNKPLVLGAEHRAAPRRPRCPRR